MDLFCLLSEPYRMNMKACIDVGIFINWIYGKVMGGKLETDQSTIKFPLLWP